MHKKDRHIIILSLALTIVAVSAFVIPSLFFHKTDAYPLSTNTVFPLTQSTITSAVVGDFNNDTNPDIIVAGTTGIEIVFGDGSGGSTGITYWPLYSITKINAGNFNAGMDSNLDIVAFQSNNLVHRIFGNGSTGYTQDMQITYSNITDVFFAPEVADVDVNGYPDIVFSNSTTGDVRLISNLSTGNLTLRVLFNVAGAGPIALADVDNDGDNDLILGTQGDNLMRIYKNNGSGDFTQFYTIATAINPLSIKAVDLNNDTFVDFVVTGKGTEGKYIYEYINDQTGGVASSTVMLNSEASNELVTGEITGDVYPDVMALSSESNSYFSYTNTLGLATFDSSYTTATVPVDGAVTDFNKDGLNDLVVVGNGFAQVFFNAIPESPVVYFTAPTKSNDATITDTTIHVTDNTAILAANVLVDASTTAGYSGFNCTQISGTVVDCTINITRSGDLTISATDSGANKTLATFTGYTITSGSRSALFVPSGTFTINGGVLTTNSRIVQIQTTYSYADEMIVSEDPNFIGAKYQPASLDANFELSDGEGEKTIYMIFRGSGGISNVISEKIIYQPVDSVPGTSGGEPEIIEPSVGGPDVLEGPLIQDITFDKIVKAPGSQYRYLINNIYRYVFPNDATYKSWFKGMDILNPIANKDLAGKELIGSINIRPGTWLVKIKTLNDVYAVEPHGVLRPILNETIARQIYGANWRERVVEIGSSAFRQYSVGDLIQTVDFPNGSIISLEGSPDVYYVEDGKKRYISAEVFHQNFFNTDFIIPNVPKAFDLPQGVDLFGLTKDNLISL